MPTLVYKDTHLLIGLIDNCLEYDKHLRTWLFEDVRKMMLHFKRTVLSDIKDNVMKRDLTGKDRRVISYLLRNMNYCELTPEEKDYAFCLQQLNNN